MANTRYENFVIANQLKDQLETRLGLLNFASVNPELAAQAGMKVKVNTYTATGGAQNVAEGQGNTQSIEMAYAQKEYAVGTTQARFVYTDEDLMADPFLVEGGIKNLSVAITNKITEDVVAVFQDAAQSMTYASAPSFDNFADALAAMDIKDNATGAEETGGEIFALFNRKMRAVLQKALKDDLKYVEAFIRTGYIGTVAGVNLYVSDAITDDTVVIGTREAVTYFRKKGVETEQDRAQNTRTNTIYGRVVGFAALTDATKCVLIEKASNFSAVASPSGNPATLGWFEKDGDRYFRTADTTVTTGKTYYEKA